eukprot:g12301.t1
MLGAISADEVPYVCWVCQRQFDSKEQLGRHEQLSKMHAARMEQNLYDNIHKREETRVTILEAKSEIRELEIETQNQVIIPPEKQSRLMQLERGMRQHEREYGQRQEQIEANRAWSAAGVLLANSSNSMNSNAPSATAVTINEDVFRSAVGDPRRRSSVGGQEDKDSIAFNKDPFAKQYPHLRYSATPNRSFPLVELSCGVSTWQGGKDMQEDRFVFDRILQGPQGEALVGYAVFDGHSGHLCAEYVVKHLFDNLQTCLSSNGNGTNNSTSSSSSAGSSNSTGNNSKNQLTEDFLKKCVVEAFAVTDARFCDEARGPLHMDGTTAVVCVLWEDNWNGWGKKEVESRVQRGKVEKVEKTTNTRSDPPQAKSLGVGGREGGVDMREGGDGAELSNLRLLCANVGDSRAVMVQKRGAVLRSDSVKAAEGSSSSGTFVPYGPVSGMRLSDDHKPDRKDEKERVEKAGGVVQDMTGVARVFTPTPLQIGSRYVQWGLAVSRSFGDLPLKEPRVFHGPEGIKDHLVSAVPEITCYHITPGRDLMLLLACDGIWDVLSDQDAALVCHGHFRAGLERVLKPSRKGPDGMADSVFLGAGGFLLPSIRHAAAQAARGVVRESFQRYSLDNLTAMVVSISPTEAWWRKVEAVFGLGGAVPLSSPFISCSWYKIKKEGLLNMFAPVRILLVLGDVAWAVRFAGKAKAKAGPKAKPKPKGAADLEILRDAFTGTDFAESRAPAASQARQLLAAHNANLMEEALVLGYGAKFC